VSYASILASLFGKRPLWLYEIRNGSARFLRTSRSNADFIETDFDLFDALDVFDTEDVFARRWKKSGIRHSGFDRSASIARSEVEITLPRSDATALSFVNRTSDRPAFVTIYHQFLNDTDNERVVKFRGRVVTARAGRELVRLTCEGGMTKLRDKALPAVIQGPCQNVLYTSVGEFGCRVNIEDWTTAGVCSAFVGRTVTCAEAAGEADGYFDGGVLRFDGEHQQIIKHTGDQLVLAARFPALASFLASASPSVANVDVAPGCRLTRANCASFNNLDNFFGFPHADESPYDGKTLY